VQPSNGMKSRIGVSTRIANDAWLHSRNWTDWSHEYEQLNPGSFRGTTTEACLGQVQIAYERVDGAFAYSGHPWKGSRIFFSFLPDSGDLYYEGRRACANALITHRWDSVRRVMCNRQAETVVLAVDEAFFNRYAADIADRDIFGPNDGRLLTCAAPPEMVSAFQQRIIEVLRELVSAPSLIANETRRMVLQNTLLEILMTIMCESPGGHCPLPRPSTRSYIVDCAMQFMESRIADPISIHDICTVLKVCPRTLRYSFQHAMGITPTQYLRAARLNRVRRELAAGSTHSVQCIAARWGFSHMGQFSQYYRRTFAESPSTTRRNASRPSISSKQLKSSWHR
jgi:AraC family transcriptional regulator, ethanolamine operon transcriptional activator